MNEELRIEVDDFTSQLDAGAGVDLKILAAFRQITAEALRLASDSNLRLRVTIDGVAFARIEDDLAEVDVFFTPLFRSEDPLVVSAGPYLIDLYRPAKSATSQLSASVDLSPQAKALADERGPIASQEQSPENSTVSIGAAKERLSRLLHHIGPSPHIVFWLGTVMMTHPVLQRHLRTLNRVLVPRENEPLSPDGASEEAVLFRHADGNALAQVLPVLIAEQRARLIGPAATVFFLAPDYPTSPGRTTQKADYPASIQPTTGMLRLTASQIDAIDARRLEQTKRLIAERLHVALSDRGAAIPDDLSGKVGRAVEEGRRLGLRSRASYWRWCTIQVPSEGQIGRHTMVRDYMTTTRLSASADERLEHMTVRLRQLLATAEGR